MFKVLEQRYRETDTETQRQRETDRERQKQSDREDVNHIKKSKNNTASDFSTTAQEAKTPKSSVFKILMENYS